MRIFILLRTQECPSIHLPYEQNTFYSSSLSTMGTRNIFQPPFTLT